MKKLIKIFQLGLLGLIIFVFFGIANSAFAVEATAVKTGERKINIMENLSSSTPGTISYKPLTDIPGIPRNTDGTIATNLAGFLRAIFNLMIGIAVLLAVIFIFWGGFQYATSEALGVKASAKKDIENALYGLGMALASWLLLYTIDPHLISLNITSVTQDTTSALAGKFGDYSAADAALIKQARMTQSASKAELDAATLAADTNQAKITAIENYLADNDATLTQAEKDQKLAEAEELIAAQATLDATKKEKETEHASDRVNSGLIALQTSLNKGGVNGAILDDPKAWATFEKEKGNLSFMANDSSIALYRADIEKLGTPEQLKTFDQNVLAYKTVTNLTEKTATYSWSITQAPGGMGATIGGDSSKAQPAYIDAVIDTQNTISTLRQQGNTQLASDLKTRLVDLNTKFVKSHPNYELTAGGAQVKQKQVEEKTGPLGMPVK
ncbi:MAG: pilin [bacterium]